MSLITIEDLKTQLKLEGVEPDLSDEDLELLLNNIVNELIGYTNVPITPVNHTTLIKDFYDDVLELDYYPVTEITSLRIGQKTLDCTEVLEACDRDLGILYFKSPLRGFLNVEYSCQVSDTVIDTIVNPLLVDIIRYRLTNNFRDNGPVTSMREGDVSLNFDSNNSLGSLIQGRIKDLKALYSIKIRVL